MNRSSKDSFAGGRSIMAESQHRRGRSISGITRDTDENLDLFSRNRRSLSVISTDESDVSLKLWRLSVESAKPESNGTDDLLSSVDGGKHDYDWLLTPPGTPLVSSLDASEPQPTLLAPRSSSSLRSVSATKASRLSAMHSENSYSSRPIRSSSVTRSSISSVMHHNTYSSNSNRSSSILNTSSLSITSSRPSTPTSRSSSTARPITSSARPVQSRSSTPAKFRPAPTISYGEKARVTQNPRPLTPTARPQTPGNLSSISARSNSRPSTPTHRTPIPAPASAPAAGRSVSVGRVLPNSRHPATASRGSSPGPHTRTSQKPIVPSDFPHETPPNLRTKLPDRPVSAGRTRPGIAVTVRGNSEASGPTNPPRRQPSPIVMRGRLPELSRRGHLHANGHDIGAPESQKIPPVSMPSMWKPAKSTIDTENTGFGRTISKKSFDMALRHMDIRHGTGSIRSLSGTTLFPQSIHSSAPKGQRVRALDPSASVSSNSELFVSSNGSMTQNGNQSLDGEAEEDDGRLSAKLSEPDIDENSHYDAILLKEDLKNTNWLLSADDTSDQGLIFDHRFEPLPELFGLI
ncbi:translation initiation factor IF-2-like isoform X2 [Telopea speciosissima]|uniref:translation initiation factor IF-2-like isoform X2 n=1 Tax=Telopea speciosissima TaxID=54955 RepID=UPI001CC473D5|nr:translation initiation factor IF-2-like isoform X2 [Telopea speciosissima]